MQGNKKNPSTAIPVWKINQTSLLQKRIAQFENEKAYMRKKLNDRIKIVEDKLYSIKSEREETRRLLSQMKQQYYPSLKQYEYSRVQNNKTKEQFALMKNTLKKMEVRTNQVENVLSIKFPVSMDKDYELRMEKQSRNLVSKFKDQQIYQEILKAWFRVRIQLEDPDRMFIYFYEHFVLIEGEFIDEKALRKCDYEIIVMGLVSSHQETVKVNQYLVPTLYCELKENRAVRAMAEQWVSNKKKLTNVSLFKNFVIRNMEQNIEAQVVEYFTKKVTDYSIKTALVLLRFSGTLRREAIRGEAMKVLTCCCALGYIADQYDLTHALMSSFKRDYLSKQAQTALKEICLFYHQFIPEQIRK